GPPPHRGAGCASTGARHQGVGQNGPGAAARGGRVAAGERPPGRRPALRAPGGRGLRRPRVLVGARAHPGRVLRPLQEREPNCTVAVFYKTGCYLKSGATRAPSPVKGRCALVPGRAATLAGSAGLRALEQPGPEESAEDWEKDELSFCARGYCRRDAVRQEGAALSSAGARPQESA
ncbi:unnamed protein product, partial [Prorocentrum cordatum]